MEARNVSRRIGRLCRWQEEIQEFGRGAGYRSSTSPYFLLSSAQQKQAADMTFQEMNLVFPGKVFVVKGKSDSDAMFAATMAQANSVQPAVVIMRDVDKFCTARAPVAQHATIQRNLRAYDAALKRLPLPTNGVLLVSLLANLNNLHQQIKDSPFFCIN